LLLTAKHCSVYFTLLLLYHHAERGWTGTSYAAGELVFVCHASSSLSLIPNLTVTGESRWVEETPNFKKFWP